MDFISHIAGLPDMRFMPAATQTQIDSYMAVHDIVIPQGYKDWLLFSDGGELFSSSIQLYGVSHNPLIEKGDNVSAPDTHMVLGTTSFGDAICFESGCEKILQWDHELNEVYLSWESFRDFLEASEEDYGFDI